MQISLTILVLSLSWILITINEYHLFKELSVSTFQTTSRILARNLSTCMAFNDYDECQRVLNTLRDEENILEGIVLNSQGRTMAEFSNNSSTPIIVNPGHTTGRQIIEIDKKTLRLAFPIHDSGKLEGTLILYADFDLLSIFIKGQSLFFTLMVIGSGLIAIVLANHLQKRVTGPLKMILGTINQIKTKKAYNLRTNINSGYSTLEFKQLTNSFDEMIEQIQIRDHSLEIRNQDLKNQIEEKVQELYKEKEKVVQNAELAALGEMAGGIAHEINNPLAVILLSSDSLKKMVTTNNFNKKKLHAYIEKINYTVDRIAKIITGLRNLSRNSEAEERILCTLKDVFDDVFVIATAKFKFANIQLRHNYDKESLKKTIKVNRIQLSQTLVNLLNNSYDAIVDDVKKWIEIQVAFTQKKCTIYVTDSGLGIPLEIRKKMFNPFYSTKDIGKGTGIGLSISKSMVEKNGGAFYYDETFPNTRFVVEFPII